MSQMPMSDEMLDWIQKKLEKAERHETRCQCYGQECYDSIGISNDVALEMLEELIAVRQQLADAQGRLERHTWVQKPESCRACGQTEKWQPMFWDYFMCEECLTYNKGANTLTIL